jgi:nucleoside-diphosphate-sugar epimerase/uncharacterized membrane protein
MADSDPGRRFRGFEKNRLEALIDGIFAVALTLLVLDIKLPEHVTYATNADLWERLVLLERHFAIYVITFIVIGIYWVGHHLQFHYVRYTDRRLIWINMFFLLLISFLPFATDMVGDHEELILPCEIYGMTLLAVSLINYIHLRYLVRHPHLASPGCRGVAQASHRAVRAGTGVVDGARVLQHAPCTVRLPAACGRTLHPRPHRRADHRRAGDGLSLQGFGVSMKRILILGVNGFVGHHLSRRILEATDWEIYGMDMQTDRIAELMTAQRFHFFEGDITINREWIEYHVKKCDVALPLVAIATPATYVREPLRVFELDFEANLPIVRAAVRYRKRLVFPSTSEVYGMCRDDEFDPASSDLVLGPIDKPRWIYACAKQLMDRVIHAYGMEQGLDYTLFRPFNWIGSGLDSINTAKEGSSRVITQFLGHIVRGEPIKLVDGGTQKRTFTYVDDGIAALLRIIDNPNGIATGKIYNIGNPANNFSVRELATMMLDLASSYPEYRDSAAQVALVETTADDYYGKGYQDVQNRVPHIANTCADLDWRPQVGMNDALRHIFDAYRSHVADARALLE